MAVVGLGIWGGGCRVGTVQAFRTVVVAVAATVTQNVAVAEAVAATHGSGNYVGNGGRDGNGK